MYECGFEIRFGKKMREENFVAIKKSSFVNGWARGNAQFLSSETGFLQSQ